MGSVRKATFFALCLLLLRPELLHAHGGPPTTQDILLGSGHISLVTSHGFFTDDGQWAWICEEATGADLAVSVVRTPGRWLVATIAGLRTSSDGCHWSSDSALAQTNILHVVQDAAKPNRVWAATVDGLWVIDGSGTASLELPSTFSVRHMGQRSDGTFLVVGFDGAQPVAQLGEQRINLPVETGRLEVLGSDAQGRFYLRFPAGLRDRLVRVSEAGAELLIAQTDPIRDVATVGNELYLLYRDGVSWSSDDGATWSKRSGTPIWCLRTGPGGFYACPTSQSPEALLYAPSLPADPALWQWDSLLAFNKITESSCDPNSTVGSVCPLFWHAASQELGVTPLELADETTTRGGCSTAPVPGPSPWPLLMLAGLFVMGRASRQPLLHGS